MPGMWCLQDHGEEAEVKSQRDGEGWNLKSKILKKVCVCALHHEVIQSYLILSNPMDCSLPGFSVHGILQARILIWVVIFFSNWGGSIQFSHSVISDSLWPHGLQHARFPCPPPTPRACSNSCSLSQWCYIQPSYPLSSPSPLTFNLSQHQGLFQWVSSLHQVAKVIRVSVSASVLPMNTQDWSPLGLTGSISLQSKGLSRIFSNTTVQKHQFFCAQLSLWSNSHIHTWLLEKP